ncbi:C3H transcription factor [Heracleum sosnowskyi]|uniref:C3H transcription factor n=1 Tax=Heracleum sosnowskyi TaxID=360622 RepID=A0AAD8MCP2_9APIA|nr:C3H transcription factor [Heracleum sosnowskyi]
MMIGDTHRSNPTVQIPPYDTTNDPTADIHSPVSVTHHFNTVSSDNTHSPHEHLTALQRYLPSVEDIDIPLDAFTCDHFRMYEFKVRRCARARSHDWTECPYAHPGEKARRRDPRKFHYSGNACPDFRKGACVRGDACEYAHGVFECWLHPARYRTQPCKDGTMCTRKVCFFAHTASQLRVLPPSSPSRLGLDSFLIEMAPGRNGFDAFFNEMSPSRLGVDTFLAESGVPSRRLGKSSFGSSPTSILYSPTESPPSSPCGLMGFDSVSELSESMRGMQIGNGGRMGMSMSVSPPTWGFKMGSSFGSPRQCSMIRPGFMSVPGTPTRKMTRSGLGVFDLWDQSCEEEPAMERVESGKDLRAKMYAKLSKENSLGRVDSDNSGSEVGWITELVK